MMLGKTIQAAVLEGWAQRLQSFTPEQLGGAFIAAEATLDAWPSVSVIVNAIFEAEYADDLRWLIQSLKLHKRDWLDREAIYGPDFRLPGAHRDDWQKGPLLEAAIAAPAISARLQRALQLLGHGTVKDGLAELSRHPAAGAFQWDAAEAGKVRFQIEKEFKAAWMIARRQELAS